MSEGKCGRCGKTIDRFHGLYYSGEGRSVCWDCVKFEYPLGVVAPAGLPAGPEGVERG